MEPLIELHTKWTMNTHTHTHTERQRGEKMYEMTWELNILFVYMEPIWSSHLEKVFLWQNNLFKCYHLVWTWTTVLKCSNSDGISNRRYATADRNCQFCIKFISPVEKHFCWVLYVIHTLFDIELLFLLWPKNAIFFLRIQFIPNHICWLYLLGD